MAPGRSSLHLRHMLDSIDRILGWTHSIDLAGYQSNPMLRDAIERCLERISEASRRVSDELKSSHPHIPWRKVADIGNVLRHGYHDVSDIEIWRIIANDLPVLRDSVSAMIDAS